MKELRVIAKELQRTVDSLAKTGEFNFQVLFDKILAMSRKFTNVKPWDISERRFLVMVAGKSFTLSPDILFGTKFNTYGQPKLSKDDAIIGYEFINAIPLTHESRETAKSALIHTINKVDRFGIGNWSDLLEINQYINERVFSKAQEYSQNEFEYYDLAKKYGIMCEYPTKTAVRK